MNNIAMSKPMNQEKPKRTNQVFYNGRWVDKDHFSAFVYNGIEQRLAKSYKDYEALISTGLWFDSKDQAVNAAIEKHEEKPQSVNVLELKKPKARKPANGANS